MTTTPRSPRLLLTTVVFAVAGIALLGLPHGSERSAPASTASASADPPSSATSVLASGTARSSTPAASPRLVVESALPPHGEGVAGDRAVQRNLETAWPADLPASDVQELLAAGRALLRADATGVGRAKWPNVFANSGGAVVPAFASARFRIQAAIARRDGGRSRAVVHLVWAGQDRGGTYTDLRITEWFFTRTIKKGAATWTPLPRT
ncbi:hypothetical protein ACWCQZ_44465 [Streptomyces sp. NPDC002285]